MFWKSRLKRNEKVFRSLLFIISGIPALYLLYQYLDASLGVNPFATLSHTTGKWSIIFLLLTLSITPMRRWLCFWATVLSLSFGKRLSDWNYLIRARRQVGLFAFFYACLHCLTYLWLDVDWQLDYFVQDVSERSFIIYGMIGFILVFLLAMTSPKVMVKKMGRWWRRLHRLMYLLVPIAIYHYWHVAKHDNPLPLYFATICAFLLLYRVWLVLSQLNKTNRDDGMEKFRN